MAADNETVAAVTAASASSGYLQKFRLYETHTKFYLVGSNNNKTQWRVLIIDRLEPSELNIHEDPTTYSTIECNDLLNRVHEGNTTTGGLKFVTKCYGLAGFAKFFGPYYMLLITRRRKIGNICGHAVYGVSKSEMIIIPNSTVRSAVAHSKDENSCSAYHFPADFSNTQYFCCVKLPSSCVNILFSGGLNARSILPDNFRSSNQYLDCHVISMIPEPFTTCLSYPLHRYKKLLCSVDLTKDFFFSYSYNIMRSLQKNLYDVNTGQILYETMFVWNEFLTHGVRNLLKNTTWTVALIHGFFKQVGSGGAYVDLTMSKGRWKKYHSREPTALPVDKVLFAGVRLSVCGKSFKFTLIARRSRHFAGTRYLKRGVNEKGRVANDVETEQIVCDDTVEQMSSEITSVVQNRGSIPLFWSQEASKLNVRPDIILHKKDNNFEATRHHFENLVKRYGNPVIILNLIKSREKKPRESLLRKEFSNAIDFINKDLPGEKCLKFLHWDIQKQSRRKGENVLEMLGKVAAYALNLTGIFYCRLPPFVKIQDIDLLLDIGRHDFRKLSCNNQCRVPIISIGSYDKCWKDEGQSSDISQSEYFEDRTKCDDDNSANEIHKPATSHSDYYADKVECRVNLAKPPRLQSGVLRTNCIDCLDRTNVAQYAYGLAALGHQLHALGFIDVPEVNLDSPLADDMMDLYERMGDTLALQYGGSGAHNKIFSERRGQWKAATQSQELLRTIQRYYNNAYMDAEKQNAINLFLGHFQPHQGKPALWELGSDQHYNIGRRNTHCHEITRYSYFVDFLELCMDSTILFTRVYPKKMRTKLWLLLKTQY
ncbi:hypothetical protein ZIOFF_064441 [Zingiber officinale]|uniref:SAC domain-containing protein n=1 Tax=Zingiber officinale TaxID=94328 RepID=A0A8J5EXP3_ZINOF|nr:hypothetical protein ZIOFF_064441 [Zingiber officinale]